MQGILQGREDLPNDFDRENLSLSSNLTLSEIQEKIQTMQALLTDAEKLIFFQKSYDRLYGSFDVVANTFFKTADLATAESKLNTLREQVDGLKSVLTGLLGTEIPRGRRWGREHSDWPRNISLFAAQAKIAFIKKQIYRFKVRFEKLKAHTDVTVNSKYSVWPAEATRQNAEEWVDSLWDQLNEVAQIALLKTIYEEMIGTDTSRNRWTIDGQEPTTPAEAEQKLVDLDSEIWNLKKQLMRIIDIVEGESLDFTNSNWPISMTLTAAHGKLAHFSILTNNAPIMAIKTRYDTLRGSHPGYWPKTKAGEAPVSLTIANVLIDELENIIAAAETESAALMTNFNQYGFLRSILLAFTREPDSNTTLSAALYKLVRLQKIRKFEQIFHYRLTWAGITNPSMSTENEYTYNPMPADWNIAQMLEKNASLMEDFFSNNNNMNVNGFAIGFYRELLGPDYENDPTVNEMHDPLRISWLNSYRFTTKIRELRRLINEKLVEFKELVSKVTDGEDSSPSSTDWPAFLSLSAAEAKLQYQRDLQKIQRILAENFSPEGLSLRMPSTLKAAQDLLKEQITIIRELEKKFAKLLEGEPTLIDDTAFFVWPADQIIDEVSYPGLTAFEARAEVAKITTEIESLRVKYEELKTRHNLDLPAWTSGEEEFGISLATAQTRIQNVRNAQSSKRVVDTRFVLALRDIFVNTLGGKKGASNREPFPTDRTPTTEWPTDMDLTLAEAQAKIAYQWSQTQLPAVLTLVPEQAATRLAELKRRYELLAGADTPSWDDSWDLAAANLKYDSLVNTLREKQAKFVKLIAEATQLSAGVDLPTFPAEEKVELTTEGTTYWVEKYPALNIDEANAKIMTITTEISRLKAWFEEHNLSEFELAPWPAPEVEITLLDAQKKVKALEAKLKLKLLRKIYSEILLEKFEGTSYRNNKPWPTTTSDDVPFTFAMAKAKITYILNQIANQKQVFLAAGGVVYHTFRTPHTPWPQDRPVDYSQALYDEISFTITIPQKLSLAEARAKADYLNWNRFSFSAREHKFMHFKTRLKLLSLSSDTTEIAPVSDLSAQSLWDAKDIDPTAVESVFEELKGHIEHNETQYWALYGAPAEEAPLERRQPWKKPNLFEATDPGITKAESETMLETLKTEIADKRVAYVQKYGEEQANKEWPLTKMITFLQAEELLQNGVLSSELTGSSLTMIIGGAAGGLVGLVIILAIVFSRKKR